MADKGQIGRQVGLFSCCAVARFICNPGACVASRFLQDGPGRYHERAGNKLRRTSRMRREFSAIVGFGLFVFSIPAWAQASACDLVTTGATPTQSDVNAAISMSIGATPCTANIMGANVCNVVVVQRVVNAAMGQPCVVGTHSVGLTWGASAAGTYPIAGYNVYRAPSSAPTQYVQINTALLTTLSFTDGAVSNSATYYYAVTAVDTQGNQSAYSTAGATTLPSS